MNPKASAMQPDDMDEVAQLRQNTLSARLKLLLLAETKERGRYSSLEADTDIPAATWRTWWNRGGAPGGLLVEAAAKRWPRYAFWLVTGNTDVRCGHDMPDLAPAAIGYISNWPEESTLRVRKIHSEYSHQYLKLLTQYGDEGSHVEHEIRKQTLRMVSSHRLAEITKNFGVALEFEQEV